MGQVVVKVADSVVAYGEASDMGVYTGCYMYVCSSLVTDAKKQQAEKDLAEKLAKEFKGIRIVPMIKKEDEKDAAKADGDSEARDL